MSRFAGPANRECREHGPILCGAQIRHRDNSKGAESKTRAKTEESSGKILRSIFAESATSDLCCTASFEGETPRTQMLEEGYCSLESTHAVAATVPPHRAVQNGSVLQFPENVA